MQILQSGYRGIELLVELNFDRAIALVVLASALLLGAYIGHP